MMFLRLLRIFAMSKENKGIITILYQLIITIKERRVCQNRHILFFVFLQARRGKILSMPLF